MEELDGLLGDGDSATSRVFDSLARLLRRRSSCPAFHPDADQEILDLGDSVFALARVSLDQAQTILCLFNFTPELASISRVGRLAEVFPMDKARDLVGGGEVLIPSEGIVLRPYQALWLV